MPNTHLMTERLILRPLEERDAPQIKAYAGDEEVAMMTLTIPYPYTIEDAEQFIQITKDDLEEGKGYVFAIALKLDDELIGCVGLNATPDHFKAEIGYWIGKPYWGRGFMTEAAQRVIQFGFEETDINRIYALHFDDNPASGRIMQKIGMQREGELRQHYFRWGRFRSAVYYGILRADYETGQSG